MISDLDLADFALLAYSEPATVETADAHAYVGQFDGMQVIALRGTDPAHVIDLLRDGEAVRLRRDPILGPCSDSFVADAEQLAWRLWPMLAPRFAITGHSKGAAEAQALAAILTHMGRPPALLVTFAPPQVGPLAGLIAALPGADFRHGADPITDVPWGRGHPRALTALAWKGPAPLDPMAYHSMQNYRTVVAGQHLILNAKMV